MFWKCLKVFFGLKVNEIRRAILSKGRWIFLLIYFMGLGAGYGSFVAEKNWHWTWQYTMLDLGKSSTIPHSHLVANQPQLVSFPTLIMNYVILLPIVGIFIIVSWITIPLIVIDNMLLFIAWILRNWDEAKYIVEKENRNDNNG